MNLSTKFREIKVKIKLRQNQDQPKILMQLIDKKQILSQDELLKNINSKSNCIDFKKSVYFPFDLNDFS